MSTIEASKKLLLIHSHYGMPPSQFQYAVEQGIGTIVRERELTLAHFDQAIGLITTSHLDQIGFIRWSDAAQALLDRGGRWFFNGHIMRELVPGLKTFVPIIRAKRLDLTMLRLNAHPIFEGIDQASFEENKGVAGFYGRGHNPMPHGASIAINGLSNNNYPVDWEWTLPSGGKFFSHAGNDMGSMGSVNPTHDLVAPRILSWALGDLNS